MDLILTDPPYALTSTRVYPKDTKLSEISDNLKEQVAKNTYYGATLRGFMGREWDGKLPEAQTWLECFRVLKPGGFILVMASPRNDDLVSVSLREAGFVKHNSIAYEGAIPAKMWWVYGSGFPKGTDVSKAIDAKAVRAWLSQHDHGLTAKEVSKVVSAAVNGEAMPESYRVSQHSEKYADAFQQTIGPKNRTAGALLISQLEEKFGSMPKRVKVGEYKDISHEERGDTNIDEQKKYRAFGFSDNEPTLQTITAPATPLAEKFSGFKYGQQHLKPSAETILVFQKPFEGSPLENILKWRVGCINVDEGRISGKELAKCSGLKKPTKSKGIYSDFLGGNPRFDGSGATNPQGRYPSNFLLSHSPGCRVVGERRVKGTGSQERNREERRGGWDDDTCGYGRKDCEAPDGYADADGREAVKEWECEKNCPVAELDRQSGESKSSGGVNLDTSGKRAGCINFGEGYSGQNIGGLGDTGTASRFFYQPEWGPADFRYMAKASSAERSAGCEGLGDARVGNPHPT